MKRHNIKWVYRLYKKDRNGYYLFGFVIAAINFMGLIAPFALLDYLFMSMELSVIIYVITSIIATSIYYVLPMFHVCYGLSHYQCDVIREYQNADKEMKKLFPTGFVDTVRNNPKDAYDILQASKRLIRMEEFRREAARVQSSEAAVALELLKSRATEIAQEANTLKQIMSAD